MRNPFRILKIIDEFPESNFKSKSMFALVFVYEELDDSISEQTKLNLLKNFPDSEYIILDWWE